MTASAPARRRGGDVPASVPSPLVAGLAAHGGRPAVVADGAELTYRDLLRRVVERAEALGGGRRLVLIGGDSGLELLVSYLAALHAGHVAWLAPDAAGPGAEQLRRTFAPDVVVSAACGGARIHERRDGSGHRLHPDLALLLGTSGSTGAPRLVRLSHDNLRSNAEAIARSLGIGASERAVTTLPMHYCYGLSVVNSHLLAGARLVLNRHSVADPAFWELLRASGGTSFAGVPHTFDLLDRTPFADLDLPSLRYVTQAGGRMDPRAVRRYAELGARRGWRLVVMYGQTEATARMAFLPPELAAAHPAAVGVPVPGGTIRLRPVPEAGPGVGEVVYRGPNVMLGYAEAPADLGRERTVHELVTGDLGRRTADGLLEIVGRRSRFVKLYGLRIDLGEVERILEREGVEAACAGSDAGLAVAVGPGVDPARAGRLLAERLGVPVARIRVTAHAALPRLPSGKPDYAAIAAAAAAAEGGAAASPVDAGDPTADAVAEAFRQVLGCARVAADDSFAGLGGDSLSYVEMSLALEEILGELPPDWPEMTVAELARRPRTRSRAAAMETGVALRAAAVLLVVASHMTAFWPAGGAHLLYAIAGHHFARFALPGLGAPGRLRRSLATVARIAVPTSAWIGVQMLLVGGYSVGALLLVNDYTGALALTGRRWEYWYIEALVQTLIVLTALMAVPAVRRLHGRHPFAFPLGLLAIALAFRFELLQIGAADNRIFRPHTLVWLFLLGWAAHRARTPAQRVAVTVLTVACVPGFFPEGARELVIVGGLALLVWVPVVRVPRPLVRPLALTAGASLYIYLTHWQVWPLLVGLMPLAPAMALTVATGVVAWRLADGLVAAGRAGLRVVASRRRRRRAPRRGLSGAAVGAEPAVRAGL